MRKRKYNFWQNILIILFLVSIFAATSMAQEISCECEKFNCGPCEVEVNIEFYTNKCGPQKSKVKSCKRPLCEPITEQDKCLAKLNKNPAADDSENASRLPASSEIPVGSVAIALGDITLQSANAGTARACVQGAKIFENDRVITGQNAKVKIIFFAPAASEAKLSDELHINPNSNVLIEKYRHPDDDIMNRTAHKTLITLNIGKIRARVNQKYDNQDNKFTVRSASAVAGVRGTDFVMSYDQDARSTKLETLSGAVEISAQNSGLKTGTPLLVAAGQSAATSYQGERSQLSGLIELDPKVLRKLDQTTEVITPEKNSGTAPKSLPDQPDLLSARADAICQSPTAEYKKCAYFCEHNPKGEKKCRTDLKTVSCVRKMCGANGQWTLPSRMPSSRSQECHGEHALVRDCGEFW